jgi:hypothetical protein
MQRKLAGNAVFLVLAWALAFAAPCTVHAQTAALLPAPSGDGRDAEHARHAAAAVRAALEAEGVHVLGEGVVLRRLPPHLRACARTDCAADVARATGVDLVAGVAVWSADGTVAVTLVTPRGHTYPGTASVAGGGVPGAARQALTAARVRQRLGPGPWLRVHGEPAGAQVLVDGTPVGLLPYYGTVAPGAHVVEVRLAGFASTERALHVGLADTDEHEVRVRLARLAAPGAAVVAASKDAPAAAAPHSRPRWGAVLLGAAGVGLLAGASVALVRQGCHARDAEGTCLRGRRLRPVPFALYAGAGAMAVLGAVLWISLPAGGARRATTDLGVGPGGLQLRRRF